MSRNSPSNVRELLMMLAESIRELAQNMEADRVRRVVHPPTPRSTPLELIVQALREASGESLTVNQIAEATGVVPSTVRAILYSRKDLFEAERDSPRRVRWTRRTACPENALSGVEGVMAA